MSKTIKGVIFDFNGVLWWDSELQERAWKEFAAKLRGRPLSEEEMSLYVHGRTNKDTLQYLVGHEISESELQRLNEEKELPYRNLCLEQGDGFKLSPGAIELLGYLSEKGMPFTIATSSEKNNVAFFFEHLDLDKWFDLDAIVYDDGTFPGKPAPDIYVRAAKKIGVHPADCLVVEDAKSGINAAHAAGIGIIAALGPREKHANLNALKEVDIVIETLGELMKKGVFER